MNILFLTSEVAPFAKTGGLADVSAALPRQLHRHGHDVRVFVPLYAKIDTRAHDFTLVPPLADLDIKLGGRTFDVQVLTSRLPDSDLPIYFVRCPALYDRPSIYTSDPDEHLRFLVLSRAGLEASRRLGFRPDVVHCNDWQTGLVPLMLRTVYAGDPLLGGARTLLTIHNLNYQGIFRAGAVGDTGLGSVAHLFHQDQLREGRVSFLLTGILYADGVTTVSPTYAQEIQTEEHGAGLHSFLWTRRTTVVGILNGVDYDEWSPEKDRFIPFRYGPADAVAAKERNKEVLLGKLGLPYRAGVPVIGIVSRLAGQKGFDLLPQVLPSMLAHRDVRLVVLGSGEQRLEDMFHGAQASFPGKAVFYRGFSNELAHLIEAGADMFLMPSRYEPCGLNQMYSLKYGTVPIVRKTGGLADTVKLWDPATGQGTGFVFEHYDAAGVRWALETALATYADGAAWRRIMANGMAQSFSWDQQARAYEQVYARLQKL